MLYDKRWDKPDPVRDAFVAWLRNQPADKGYYYYDSRVCACAQFCRQTRRVRDWFWRYGERAEHEREVWQRFDTLAAHKPHTFGALLRRMEIFSRGGDIAVAPAALTAATPPL